MNTELRNKLFNKIKNVFENEDTQEREAFLKAREDVDYQYDSAFLIGRIVFELYQSMFGVSILDYLLQFAIIQIVRTHL